MNIAWPLWLFGLQALVEPKCSKEAVPELPKTYSMNLLAESPTPFLCGNFIPVSTEAVPCNTVESKPWNIQALLLCPISTYNRNLLDQRLFGGHFDYFTYFSPWTLPHPKESYILLPLSPIPLCTGQNMGPSGCFFYNLCLFSMFSIFNALLEQIFIKLFRYEAIF